MLTVAWQSKGCSLYQLLYIGEDNLRPCFRRDVATITDSLHAEAKQAPRPMGGSEKNDRLGDERRSIYSYVFDF